MTSCAVRFHWPLPTFFIYFDYQMQVFFNVISQDITEFKQTYKRFFSLKVRR